MYSLIPIQFHYVYVSIVVMSSQCKCDWITNVTMYSLHYYNSTHICLMHHKWHNRKTVSTPSIFNLRLGLNVISSFGIKEVQRLSLSDLLNIDSNISHYYYILKRKSFSNVKVITNIWQNGEQITTFVESTIHYLY